MGEPGFTQDQMDVSGAYHEAGHAVAYMALGYDVGTVTIGEYENRVSVPTRRINGFDKAAVIWAGPMAQHRHLFRGDDLWTRWRDRVEGWREEWASDPRLYQEVMEYCDNLDSDEYGLFVLPDYVREAGLMMAERILDDRWLAVEALAAGLMDRGTLTHAEAVTIMGLSA